MIKVLIYIALFIFIDMYDDGRSLSRQNGDYNYQWCDKIYIKDIS